MAAAVAMASVRVTRHHPPWPPARSELLGFGKDGCRQLRLVRLGRFAWETSRADPAKDAGFLTRMEVLDT